MDKNPEAFRQKYAVKATSVSGEHKEVCPECHLYNAGTEGPHIKMPHCRDVLHHTVDDWTKYILAGGTFRLHDRNGGFTDFVVEGMTEDGLAICKPDFPSDSNLLYYYMQRVSITGGGRYV